MGRWNLRPQIGAVISRVLPGYTMPQVFPNKNLTDFITVLYGGEVGSIILKHPIPTPD